MPSTHLVVCAHREADLFDLYDQAAVAPKNLHLLVRAQHDRLLESGPKLRTERARQPVSGTMPVQVPRTKTQPARTATLELKWTRLEVTPPRVARKKSWQPLKLSAVLARAIDPPAGIEPIEWGLLPDWKVQSLKRARRWVCRYGLRWGIECWHQVPKDVCGVETRQIVTVISSVSRWIDRALHESALANQVSTRPHDSPTRLVPASPSAAFRPRHESAAATGA